MHRSATPEHASHDTTLIAAHAAGDPGNDTAAAALLATCAACSELHRDLIAITAATRDLPRTARAPRDFRLTAEQAIRLRRGSWLRSLLQPFASRGSPTRALAPVFTSAGLAGILVALIVPGLLGGAASAPGRDMTAAGQQAAGAPAPEQQERAPGAVGGAAASGDTNVVKAGTGGTPTTTQDSNIEMALGGSTPDSANGGAGSDRTSAETPAVLAATPGPNPLVVGSLAMLFVGLVLFGLRFAARRLR
jgi:hypothetical protein